MFTSALCVFSWLQAGFAISGWIGLPGRSGQIASAQTQAIWSAVLALLLPFAAALVLTLSSGNSPQLRYAGGTFRNVRVLLSQRYTVQLIISVLGSAGFIAFLTLLGWIFQRLHPLIPH